MPDTQPAPQTCEADGLTAAVDGPSSQAGGDGITGLSQMAERPRPEATGFLAEMRR